MCGEASVKRGLAINWIFFRISKRSVCELIVLYAHMLLYKNEINRGYLLFWGEYLIYFIECGEKN